MSDAVEGDLQPKDQEYATEMWQMIEINQNEAISFQPSEVIPPVILSVEVSEYVSPVKIGEVVFDSQIFESHDTTPQETLCVPKLIKHVHFDLQKNSSKVVNQNEPVSSTSTTNQNSTKLDATVNPEETRYTNNETLRKKPWSDVSPEEKEFFTNKMDKSAAHSLSIDRHPNILRLGVDNEILGETPLLQDDNDLITIQDRNNKQCVLLKLYNNMGILIVDEVQVANDAMFQTCGKIMANGYLPLENKKGFSIGFKVETGDLMLKALQLSQAQNDFDEKLQRKSTKSKAGKSPLHDIKWKQFAIYCHCNKAQLAKNESNVLISCSSCQEKYHKLCVRNNSTSFVCNSCSIKTQGLKWAANPKLVTNTCTFDNQLSHFAFRCEKSANFKSLIITLQGDTTLLKQAFAHATLNVLDNNSSAAQQCWANAVMLKKKVENLIKDIPKQIDMLGGTDEFYEQLQDLGEFFVKDIEKCSQCSTQTNHKKNEIYITLTTELLQNFLESQVFQDVRTPCQVDGCQGQVLQTKLQIPKDFAKPLWLVVKNVGSLQGPEAFLDFPKYLTISNERFQLGIIVLYDGIRNHFTSLHNIAESWMFYDGLPINKKPRTPLHQLCPRGITLQRTQRLITYSTSDALTEKKFKELTYQLLKFKFRQYNFLDIRNHFFDVK
jgi:hypothetical protein